MPAYDQKDIEAKRRVKTAEKPAAATPSASRSGGYRVAASDAIAGDEVGNPDAQACTCALSTLIAATDVPLNPGQRMTSLLPILTLSAPRDAP